MSRESTRKHRDYQNEILVKREGKTIAELGPERLELEGDMLEDEGMLLDNDAFDKALASGQIDEAGFFNDSKLDVS